MATRPPRTSASGWPLGRRGSPGPGERGARCEQERRCGRRESGNGSGVSLCGGDGPLPSPGPRTCTRASRLVPSPGNLVPALPAVPALPVSQSPSPAPAPASLLANPPRGHGSRPPFGPPTRPGARCGVRPGGERRSPPCSRGLPQRARRGGAPGRGCGSHRPAPAAGNPARPGPAPVSPLPPPAALQRSFALQSRGLAAASLPRTAPRCLFLTGSGSGGSSRAN